MSPEKEARVGAVAATVGAGGGGGLATSLRMGGKVKLGQIRGLLTSVEVKSTDSVETSPPSSR